MPIAIYILQNGLHYFTDHSHFAICRYSYKKQSNIAPKLQAKKRSRLPRPRKTRVKSSSELRLYYYRNYCRPESPN